MVYWRWRVLQWGPRWTALLAEKHANDWSKLSFWLLAGEVIVQLQVTTASSTELRSYRAVFHNGYSDTKLSKEMRIHFDPTNVNENTHWKKLILPSIEEELCLVLGTTLCRVRDKGWILAGEGCWRISMAHSFCNAFWKILHSMPLPICGGKSIWEYLVQGIVREHWEPSLLSWAHHVWLSGMPR